MPWFVMRDLTRANCKRPAWLRLEAAGYRVYTPMTWKVRQAGGRKLRIKAPVVHDLLFVQSTRSELDPYVDEQPTLQYRYVKGGYYQQAMEVDERDMERFMLATSHDEAPLYFTPEEMTPSMTGRKVRIIGGALHGFTGHLLSVRGMRKKRLLVELPQMLTAAVEVSPDLIELIDDN